MDDIKKKKILIFLLAIQICLGGIIGYNFYTYKAPLIDLNITIQDNNTSKPIIHLDNEIQTPIIKCDKELLLRSFAENALRSFRENKKCGFIYNSVLSDLENQDIKVYAVVIEDPSISHIIPVIQLENNTYYGYDHQFNAIYTTIVRGEVSYNIYSGVEGVFLKDGEWQITKWKLEKENASVFIELAEFKELYNYKSINDNWLYVNLVDQYALKYDNNISVCGVN